MKKFWRTDALIHKYPNLYNGKDYELYNDDSEENRIFEWITTEVEKPTDEEMKVWYDEWENLEYQRLRKYPPIEEQLDMLYWDRMNGTERWIQAIKKVKDKHPKK